MSAADVRAELAEVLVSADDTIDLRYGRHVADVILASDWLAEYVASKQAEALREAAEWIVLTTAQVGCDSCAVRAEGAASVWLRDRADRIAP